MKSNIFWVILFGGLVLVSAVIAVVLWNAPASYAKIYQNGKLTETVNLTAITEPFTIMIDTKQEKTQGDGVISSSAEVKSSPVFIYPEQGRVNMIEAEYGRIRMLGANCPDGLCVRQGWINSGLMPIVCLPNRVIIALESADNAHKIDAVVG